MQSTIQTPQALTREVFYTLREFQVIIDEWRKDYGGMKVSQARRLKELKRENARLEKAMAELTLDKLILKEAVDGNY